MDDKKLKEKMHALLKDPTNHFTMILMPGGEVRELDSHYLFDANIYVPKDVLDK